MRHIPFGQHARPQLEETVCLPACCPREVSGTTVNAQARPPVYINTIAVTPGTFRLNAVTQRKHLSSPHVSLPRCNSGPAFAPVFDVGETRVLFISLPFPSLLLRSFLCLPFRFRGFRRANRIVVYPHVRPAVCRHGTTRFAHDRFLLNFVFLDICYMFVDTLPVW